MSGTIEWIAQHFGPDHSSILIFDLTPPFPANIFIHWEAG
jgi:hypothetical protein